MGTYYIDHCNASKLYDANEANPSAENGSFVDWSVDDEFILALQVLYDDACNKATVGSQFKLQFSEDGGGWQDVAADTAIAWGTNTSLVDDAAGTQKITSATPAGCSGSFEGANENEGDNTLPDSGTIAVGTAENWREFHWALNPANATPGSVYTFQCVNITNSNTALIGAVSSSVTIAGLPLVDADDLTSQPTISEPTINGVRLVGADGLTSQSTIGVPEINIIGAVEFVTDTDFEFVDDTDFIFFPEAAGTNLNADDLTSASSVSAPTIDGVRLIDADNVTSTPSISVPAIDGVRLLPADPADDRQGRSCGNRMAEANDQFGCHSGYTVCE